MTPERWQQVYELFNEALSLSPGDREAMLDSRCAADPELRAEVDRLLVRDTEAEREEFLAIPPATEPAGMTVRQHEAVHIHCPHCGHAIELVDLMVADEVLCPTCHSSLHLQRPGTLPWSTRRRRATGLADSS